MHPGKLLILIGLLIAFIGLLALLAGKVPFLGRLPGDIRIERENFTFYFPLTTSLIVSGILSLFFWLFRR